jgi:drug/metabolite transporter (DMT)-like permease
MAISQSVALVAIAVAVAARAESAPAFVRLLPAAGGGLAGVAALAAFYRALSIGTMSVVAPIAATGVVVPIVVGVAGGERPAALQIVGIFAAIVGVMLASRERGPDAGAASAGRLSIVLALAAALGFGAFAVGMRASARADVPWALVSARVPAVLAVAIAFALARPGWRAGGAAGASVLPLAAVGILDLTANALFALATRHGLLSIVGVASSLYPLATVILARVVLRERVRRVQEVGIAAAVTGVVLMAAG